MQIPWVFHVHNDNTATKINIKSKLSYLTLTLSQSSCGIKSLHSLGTTDPSISFGGLGAKGTEGAEEVVLACVVVVL